MPGLGSIGFHMHEDAIIFLLQMRLALKKHSGSPLFFIYKITRLCLGLKYYFPLSPPTKPPTIAVARAGAGQPDGYQGKRRQTVCAGAGACRPDGC